MKGEVRRRRGMTLVETIVMGLVGLLVVAAVVQILSAAWRHDTWTGGRLDTIGAIYQTMDQLRVDLFHSSAGMSDPARKSIYLRVTKPGQAPETAIYSWKGPGQPLTRNGKPLGFSKPAAVGMDVFEGCASLYLDVPSTTPEAKTQHDTRLSVPVVVPEAYWAERCYYWAPRVR
jgi:hypothetical protein